MKSRAEKGLVRLNVLDESGRRQYVCPADVHGRFARVRPWVFAALIALYLALPWIKIGGHPAVFLNIAARRFFLFGKAFNAQDTYLVFFLLSGVGFALIVLAALFGRIWCGWACPQTVFLEGVYRRIERLIEGPASRRQSLNKGPFTMEKLAKKSLKHGVYLAISFVLAHMFLAYFLSLPELFAMMRKNPLANWTSFLWGFGLTAILYWNFFWFREQLCLIICPYGRLQSVMQDPDTIVIGYDKKRGEPRGKAKTPGAGDCVDCGRCIAVCPTAIDIRDGSQMDCVGCTGCIDACDEIMDRLGRPRGLIRYDSERGFTSGERRFFRPRVFAYVALGLLGVGGSLLSFLSYKPFEANVLRGHGAPYVIDGERVRNQLLVHLVNKSPQPATFFIESVAGTSPSPIEVVIAQPRVELAPLENLKVPIVLTVEKSRFRPGLSAALQVRGVESGVRKELHLNVLGPTVLPGMDTRRP